MQPPPTSPLGQLLAGPMNAGKLIWIGLREFRHGPVFKPNSASLVAGKGIEGDRYKTNRNGGRQVALIETESLNAIASYLQSPKVDPELLRRNLVMQGINLHALRDKRFRVEPKNSLTPKAPTSKCPYQAPSQLHSPYA